ncbi:MAG: methyl-accepting chemotaxis protein [Leptospiraceae bacterium]|nr:methyl-accepting chemotaxis protein [Leptospiraceae bacterium]
MENSKTAIHKTLRFQLSLISIIIMTIFAAILLIISAYLSYNNLKSSYVNQLENINESLDNQTNQFYEQQKTFVSALSKSPIIVNALLSNDFRTANSFLAGVQKEMPIFENIFISSPSFKPVIVGGSIPKSFGLMWKLPANELNIKNSLEGNIQFSEPHKSPVSGDTGLLITAPVYSGKNIIGIFGVAIYYNKLILPVIQNTSIGEIGFTMMANSDGTIVAHKNESNILSENIKNYSFGEEIIKSSKENDIIYGEIEGESVMIYFKKNPQFGYSIISVFYTYEIWNSVKTLSYSLFGLLIFGTLINAVIIYFNIRKRLTPLQLSSAKALEISSGVLTEEKLEFSSKDEFSELMESMHKLTGRVTGIIKDVQNVAENLEKTSIVLSDNTESFMQNISSQSKRADDIYEFLITLNAGITEISSETKNQFLLLNK